MALVVGYLAMFSGSIGEQAWAHWTEFGLTTVVQFYVGWPFLREAAKRARALTANMDTLIALGTLTAYTFSTTQLVFFGGDLYFETAALIIAFLVLGRFFEARSKRSAGKAIRALLELGAKEARVLRDGAEVLVHRAPSPPARSLSRRSSAWRNDAASRYLIRRLRSESGPRTPAPEQSGQPPPYAGAEG